jgi:hypothetical protein
MSTAEPLHVFYLKEDITIEPLQALDSSNKPVFDVMLPTVEFCTVFDDGWIRAGIPRLSNTAFSLLRRL